MDKHVFISYKHEDSDFAEILRNRVEKAGFKTWVDTDGLPAGEDWRAEIDQAIKGAFALIVIMTPEAKASEYVTYEWSFAWGAQVKVIPVLLKHTPLLHPRLEALQYLDFSNFATRPWDKLIARLKDTADSDSSLGILQSQNILLSNIISAASYLVAAEAGTQNKVQTTSPLSVAEKIKEIAKSINWLITPKASEQLSGAWSLWVDDVPTNNSYVRQALEELGIRIAISTSTEDALQKVHLRDYKVIISDNGRPPDPNAGYTLLEKLKEEHINTPFIIYSSRRGSKDIAEDRNRKSGIFGASNSSQELVELVIKAIQKG